MVLEVKRNEEKISSFIEDRDQGERRGPKPSLFYLVRLARSLQPEGPPFSASHKGTIQTNSSLVN